VIGVGELKDFDEVSFGFGVCSFEFSSFTRHDQIPKLRMTTVLASSRTLESLMGSNFPIHHVLVQDLRRLEHLKVCWVQTFPSTMFLYRICLVHEADLPTALLLEPLWRAVRDQKAA